MTVSAVGFSGPTYVQIPGNGAATAFSFPFLISAATDLKVGFIAGGSYSEQTSAFTVTGVGSSGGGQVTFATAPPSGTTVDIRSVIPETQPTNFSNLGGYYPESTTNALDRAVRNIADLYRLTYQFGIHGPDTESTVWPSLPASTSRANTNLTFDANGLPTCSLQMNEAPPLSASLIGQLLFPQTALEIAAGVTPTFFQFAPGVPARYGADPTGVTDSTAAINICTSIAFGKIDFAAGTYLISPSTHAGLPGVFSSNSVCLQPRSNQQWNCRGATFNLANGYNATSGAMVGNWTGAALNNWECVGGTWNGNSANVMSGLSCSGIQLVDATYCTIRETYQLNPSYNGIGIRRSSGVSLNNIYGSFMCSVKDNIVVGAGYIGIQANLPEGINITGNQLYSCGNNSIDSDANNPAGDPGSGLINRISENIIKNSENAGIWIESAIDYMICDNRLQNYSTGAAGIYLNRINSGAKDINITGNKFSQDTQGGYGILVGNNCGNVFISNNRFNNHASSILLNGTGTNVGIGTNYHASVERYCVDFSNNASAVVFSYFAKQMIEDSCIGTGGFPYLCPPLNCPSSTFSRGYEVTLDGLVSFADGKLYLPNYQLGYVQLASPFSAYVSSKTQITLSAPGTSIAPAVLASNISALGYLMLAGTAYKIEASVGTNVYTVQQWNGTAYVDGNFTSALSYAIFGDWYSGYWAIN